jgi:hypothetical protein
MDVLGDRWNGVSGALGASNGSHGPHEPGPRRGKVHRPSAAPSPGTAASASERRVLAQISQNEQSLGGVISDQATARFLYVPI